MNLAAILTFFISNSRYSANFISTELYAGIMVVLFTGFAIWIREKLTSTAPEELKEKPFKRNERATKALGTSEKELKVLEQWSKGRSTQEIADKLTLSTNKVKNTLFVVHKKNGSRSPE
ncbi:MAG: LuxR C-terminal-related transcriptional regulator [Gracilimonas sp.]|uniref:LuxR C-terminal-related transcriptional regulator n=1 Tax=Gracilimonas sp. TaxID=1974203 RepID=UPI003750E50E|nr:LuxR C-terminal-related transcriptional regulator [Gracilimonas sp.]